MNNQPKVLQYLLKTVRTYKNDVQNKLGRTALNIAASQGAFECIKILLENLNCDINSIDKVTHIINYSNFEDCVIRTNLFNWAYPFFLFFFKYILKH